jgi:hypothetical protein
VSKALRVHAAARKEFVSNRKPSAQNGVKPSVSQLPEGKGMVMSGRDMREIQ